MYPDGRCISREWTTGNLPKRAEPEDHVVRSRFGFLGQAGAGPVFVKVDVEGYEYHLGDELAELRDFNLKGAQIAVHPQLYEMSLAGGFLRRRLVTAWRTWQLSRLFHGMLPKPTLAKYPGVLKYLLSGILFRKVPRGADFVFERTIPEGAP